MLVPNKVRQLKSVTPQSKPRPVSPLSQANSPPPVNAVLPDESSLIAVAEQFRAYALKSTAHIL